MEGDGKDGADLANYRRWQGRFPKQRNQVSVDDRVLGVLLQAAIGLAGHDSVKIALTPTDDGVRLSCLTAEDCRRMLAVLDSLGLRMEPGRVNMTSVAVSYSELEREDFRRKLAARLVGPLGVDVGSKVRV